MSGFLNIGTTGLLVAQNALNTIGNNIANASTPGYNRQVTLLDSLPAQQLGSSYIGSGVSVQSIQRVVNNFVVQSLWVQQSNLSEFDSFNTIMSQLDSLLGDPSLSVTEGLTSLFNALQDVTTDPSSIPARQIFITQAEILQNRLNELNAQFENQFSNINGQIVQDVATINSLTQQIASLNSQIQNAGSYNFASAPNDLLDKRENLILSLSEYVGVSTFTQDNGAVNVFIGNGQSLVIGNQSITLSTIFDPTNAANTNIVVANASYVQDITNSFQSGAIGGLINIRDNILPQALNAIGRIGISIAMTFNDQHKLGIDLNSNIGTNMFNDPNDYNAILERSIPSINNVGNAIFGVTINPIATQSEIYSVYSSASNMVPAGSLSPMTSGMLSINGISIRGTGPSDDTLSTTDRLASAIAISNAINSQSSKTMVTATPQATALYLGQFTPGAIISGNLILNGIDILSTGIDEETLLQDINALTAQTGITATGDGNLHITLVAGDGRNIEIAKTVNSAVASFSYFTMNVGGALDNVVRGSVELVSQNKGSFSIGGFSPNSIGFTSGSYPPTYLSLCVNDYQLSFNGSAYTLTRLPDMTIVGTSATPSFTIDGFTISLQSGVVSQGDSFAILPSRYGARDFSFNFTDPSALAMASTVVTNAALSNKGSAQIAMIEITNTSGFPAGTTTKLGNAFTTEHQLTPPIMIQFSSATTYQVYDISGGNSGVPIGPEQKYNPTSTSNNIFPLSGVVDTTAPGPNSTYIYDPGYRISLTGVANMGDVFTVGYNNNPSGDNRNALLLASFQSTKTMMNNSASYQDAFIQFVGTMGGQAAQAQINLDSGQSIFDSIQTQRNQISGVNIDEEAANLLKFEQAYQATAQVIVTAKGVFDALLRAVGGY